jgi:hypothetical protein
MLNELDRELTARGHRFVRYADDCMIFCKSRKSAERTLTNIIPFIEDKMFLTVNRRKQKQPILIRSNTWGSNSTDIKENVDSEYIQDQLSK